MGPNNKSFKRLMDATVTRFVAERIQFGPSDQQHIESGKAAFMMYTHHMCETRVAVVDKPIISDCSDAMGKFRKSCGCFKSMFQFKTLIMTKASVDPWGVARGNDVHSFSVGLGLTM